MPRGMRSQAVSARLLVQELGGPGAALADEVVLQPLACDPLELAEEVQLRLLAGVAPLGFQKPPGEVENHGGRAHLLEMLEAQVHALADDALVARDERADQIGGELQRRVVVERGREPLLRELDAVPLHARKADLAGIPLRRDRPDLYGLARRLRRGDHGPGREVEGDAEHVGVFDVEHPLLVQIVGLPAQRPADHLLAQELCAERVHSEHVGDGAGVPALGQHGDGHHAAGVAAKTAGLPDGVHDLSEQVLVGEVLGLPAVPRPLDDLAAEPLDLVAGGGPEVPVERLPGLELLAVDEQGTGPRKRTAVLVEVPEEREPARHQRRGAVLVLALEARDVVVDQLGGRGVVAHHDEARRDLDAGVLPQLEGAGVMAVEGFERGLELDGDAQGVEGGGLSPAFPRPFPGPSSASSSRCGARDCGTSASHRRGCYRQPAPWAASRCRTRWHPSVRSRSPSRGRAFPPRSRTRAGRTVSRVEDAARGLPALVEFPVARRVLVRAG